MTRRGLLFATVALLAAGAARAADPMTASAGSPALLRLSPAPSAAGQRVVLDVTMLSATGAPASAVLALRGSSPDVYPLGQLAPYPSSFDSKAGDPAQQAQFDVTDTLRAHPDEHGWTLLIELQPLSPTSRPAPRQTFVASFATAPR